jgi:hypothetical protein
MAGKVEERDWIVNRSNFWPDADGIICSGSPPKQGEQGEFRANSLRNHATSEMVMYYS